MKKKVLFLLLTFLFLIFSACNQNLIIKIDGKEVNQVDGKAIEEAKPRVESLRIKAFGDIMFHMPQVRYARQPDGGYDFSESFSEVKDFVNDADLSIGNFESTTNPNRPPSSFPFFNTPQVIFYNLKMAGFDALSTGNNHCLDTGVEGIIETLNTAEYAGIKAFGTKRPGEKAYQIFDIKDIKIGLLAYSESLNGMDSLLDTEEKKTMVNRLDEELIKSDIEELKTLGCDLVLIYPHWGVEYQSQMNPRQTVLAHKMLEWGADIIVGNHPHVVQPTECYKTQDGRDCFIAYSCGNFYSNQRKETIDWEPALNVPNSERTEQSIGYEFLIEKNFETGQTIIKDVIFHPMWVGLRDGEKGRRMVKAHLCSDYLSGGKKYEEIDDNLRVRIGRAYKDTMETTKTINPKLMDSSEIGNFKAEIIFPSDLRVTYGEKEFLLDGSKMRPWKVEFCNIDGGEPELLVGVYKESPHHKEEAPRPFFYNIDLEAGRLKAKIRLSRLSNPLKDFIMLDIDGDGRDEIVSLELAKDGTCMIGGYKWTNFAFERAYTSEPLDGKIEFLDKEGKIGIEDKKYILKLSGEEIVWQ